MVRIKFRLGRYLSQPIISFDYAQDEITISNNIDIIKDLNVEIEYTNTNLVYVYNSAGTSFRELLVFDNVNTNTEERTIPAKEALIMSDDSIETLRAQYINEYNLNHKITFTIDYPNNFISFDDMKLGTRVNFYEGSQLYQSVITGISYNIGKTDNIGTVKYTLGKARSNLTSKLSGKK